MLNISIEAIVVVSMCVRLFLLALLANCGTRSDARCIGHQMRQQILFHDAAKEMRLRALRKDSHILTRVHALTKYIAGRKGS